MYLRWLLFIMMLLSCTNCVVGNIVISGNVPSSTGKIVSVNEYLDFVSRSRKVVMQVEVDATGYFLIRLKNVKGLLINLEIGNLSLDIYVSDKRILIFLAKRTTKLF